MLLYVLWPPEAVQREVVVVVTMALVMLVMEVVMVIAMIRR